MNDKVRITIEIPNTGLEENILRKGEWEDSSLFGMCLRSALMHFTKEAENEDMERQGKDMLEQKQLDTILLSNLPTEVKIFRIANILRNNNMVNPALWYAILEFKNAHIREYEWVESEESDADSD